MEEKAAPTTQFVKDSNDLVPANSVQIGGDHYKNLRGMEPWDVILHWGLGFLDGNAVKYLARWRSKGGVTDLEKARHYITKLIEVEHAKKRVEEKRIRDEIEEFRKASRAEETTQSS